MTAQAISSEKTLAAQSLHSTQRTISSTRLWAGRILSGLSAMFLLMDGGMKLAKPRFVVEATVQLGYPESVIVGIGLVLLASTIFYLVPRTAILGAILLTGYLGGAVASKVRVEADLFNIVFPVVFGGLLWAGLWLRDRRLQQLVPLRAL
jgi:DoxX-like family